MFNLAELAWTLGIVTLAILMGRVDPIKEPFRVDVCLVKSGPEGEDVTTNLWNDQLEVYFEKYPNSYCGKCGSERKCPED